MTKTIIVAQGMCSPIRGKILSALKPYGAKVEVVSYSKNAHSRGIDGATFCRDGEWVQQNVGEVYCSDAAAKWVEYLLLRTENFSLLSQPIDPRNMRWAARHGGKMPTPWSEEWKRDLRRHPPTGPCADKLREAQRERESKRSVFNFGGR